MLHCSQIAVRHIATMLAGCLLRSNMNGSFRECGKAASVEADWRQRAA